MFYGAWVQILYLSSGLLDAHAFSSWLSRTCIRCEVCYKFLSSRSSCMNDLILLLYLKSYVERSRLSGAQMGCKGKEVGHVCNGLALWQQTSAYELSTGL